MAELEISHKVRFRKIKELLETMEKAKKIKEEKVTNPLIGDYLTITGSGTSYHVFGRTNGPITQS